MPVKHTLIILFLTGICFSSTNKSFYADITDELMAPPTSASMAGSDLSTGNGVSSESTPGNLPFDSLNRRSLSYAGFFSNAFSTSILTYNGKPRKDIGVSVLLGYIYVPDIMDNRASTATDSGELRNLKYSYYSASRIIFRAGAGRLFELTPQISIGTGIAINAKRVRLPDLGYGIGMDAGARVLFKNPGISLAVQIENITTSYTYWTSDYQELSLPQLRAGAGFERYFASIYGSLKLSYASPDIFANDGINDIDHSGNTADRYELYDKPSLLFSQGRYGIEYTILNAVSFRGGLCSDRFTFGAGLCLMHDKAGIDFAYIAHALAGTYQLSLNYKW